MAWEECVTSIHQNLDPNAQEVLQVNWASIPVKDLQEDNFAIGDPFSLICPDRHCVDYADFSPQAHSVCNCKDINGKDIPGCTPKNPLYPFKSNVCVNTANPNDYSGKRSIACTSQGSTYYPLTCYCCCSCYANGTKIAVPLGFKTIEYFQKGDEVMTAFVSSGQLRWRTGKVAFSMGTGPTGHQSAMVYIHYGNDDRQIVVTPDQLFLMDNGKLKRADRLVPGVDNLVNEFGNSVPIHEISIGEYMGGVHHISTSEEFTGELDGHLLLSEGVVSGDFSLQVSARDLIERGLMDDHTEQPKIGSQEYEQANNQLAKEFYGVAHVTALADGSREKVQRPQQFYVHGERSIDVPETAAAYFDDAQADDIYNNAPRWDFEQIGINAPMVKYVLRLFKGFYPATNFFYDQSNVVPNAYAYESAGVMNVVMTGGMTRLKGLEQEGLSFILAHMLSASQKLAPAGAGGWTSVAMADYYSMSVLMELYFGKTYGQMYRTGVRQLHDSVFQYISNTNDRYTNDPYHPTVAMRFDAMDAGSAMDFPPAGIGGPVMGGLKVVDAKVFAPMVGMLSFMTPNIDEDQSQEAYGELVRNNVVTDNGEVSPEFNMDSDLNFLFPAVLDDNQRSMMIGEVRSRLLHAPGTIQLEFNDQVNPASASSYHDFTLDPDALIISAEAKMNIPVVEIMAELKRGTEYTLTVSTNVRSTIGSTIDMEARTIKVKLA